MNNIVKVELGDRIQESYIGYAISTIVDRALPDVRDGLLPVHRRILYSMFKEGMLHNKEREKSTAPVAATMKIHPHGDASIYESMALLTEQNQSLLHPFIDGEGSFGKVYSADSPSSMRYTYARLNKFAQEMFLDLDKNIVKMIGEHNHKQPLVLPATYPAILVKPNKGIAVGEACNFGSFPLQEVCSATIAYINNKDINLLDYMTPDFSTGGYLIYDREQLSKIYETGKGSVKLRSKYRYDKEQQCIEVYEIPYSTTVERIISEVLNKIGKFKEIVDIRDESGFDGVTKKEGLVIAIDVKKDTNIENLMNRLFKETTLETSFAFNMNCLVDLQPRVLGVKSILDEWLSFRRVCVQHAIQYDIDKKSKELHVLLGLEKILLDIDKAIHIIRFSEQPAEELMTVFSITKEQADSVLQMRLRYINEIQISNKIKDINSIREEVELLNNNINNVEYINNIIIEELTRVSDEYCKDRHTEIIDKSQIQTLKKEELMEDYNCRIVYTNNYIKKHLKYSDSHKFKEGEVILGDIESTNRSTLMIITSKGNRYKLPTHVLDLRQPSHIGDYIRNHVELEPDEDIVKIVSVEKPVGYIVYVYANGKVAKIDIKSFMSNNVKLANCFNMDSPLVAVDYVAKDVDILLVASNSSALIVDSSMIGVKSTRNSQGNIGIKIDSDMSCISAYINPPKNLNFEITTKTKIYEFYIDDVAPTGNPTEQRSLYQYIKGRNGNKGNRLLQGKKTITDIKYLK